MKHYILGEVVDEISEREKNPSVSGYERFVGLEHYVSGDVEIKKYGTTENLNSSMKVFKSGDILVARRNVYLKRASVVYFDGLTSGDSIVLRAKNENIGRVLPFILNTSEFWDYADQHSDGTMSKRLSPKVLKAYEFDLPDDTEIEGLADLLWSLVDTKNAYEELLIKTDDLVKSQFIEMFADVKKGVLSDMATIIMGQSPAGKTYNDNGDGMAFYQGKTEFGELYIGEATKWTTAPSRIAKANDVLMSVRAPVGSTNITTEECCIGRGLAAIRPIEEKTTTMFILYAMRIIEENIANMGVGSTFKAINKGQIHKLPIPLASIELQNLFVEIAEQSEKSKFELKQAIESIDNLIKSILYSNLEEKKE